MKNLKGNRNKRCKKYFFELFTSNYDSPCFYDCKLNFVIILLSSFAFCFLFKEESKRAEGKKKIKYRKKFATSVGMARYWLLGKTKVAEYLKINSRDFLVVVAGFFAHREYIV